LEAAAATAIRRLLLLLRLCTAAAAAAGDGGISPAHSPLQLCRWLSLKKRKLLGAEEDKVRLGQMKGGVVEKGSEKNGAMLTIDNLPKQAKHNRPAAAVLAASSCWSVVSQGEDGRSR
jgi:hypothetical protein